MNAWDLLPAIRELFGQHPLASGCSPEQIAALLWVLRYVPERPEAFKVEAALEPLSVELERAA